MRAASNLPGRLLRATAMLLLAFGLAACASKNRSPIEEEVALDNFRQSLFVGMLKSDMLKAARKEPTLHGKSIDDDIYIFEYRTSRSRSLPTFEHIKVRLERASDSVVSWE